MARIGVLLKLTVALATGLVGLAALTAPARPGAFAAVPLSSGGVGVGIRVLGPSLTATPSPPPSSAPAPPTSPPPASAPAPPPSPAAPPLMPPAPPVAGGGGLPVTGTSGRWLLTEILVGLGAVLLGGILVRLTVRRRRG